MPLAGWIVERTDAPGGAPSAPITNRNKSPRFVAVGMTPRRPGFRLKNRREP